MRLTKYVTIGLTAAALAASGASAHGGPGKDKMKAGGACRPAPVMLAGTLANDPAAGDTSFQLTVKHANHLGRLYAKAGNPVSVSVDATTRLRMDGKAAAIDALSQNDRAIVLAKVCRADVKAATKAGTSLPAMTARLVLAKSPAAPSSPDDSGSDS
jgi:hypothetical protein